MIQFFDDRKKIEISVIRYGFTLLCMSLPFFRLLESLGRKEYPKMSFSKVILSFVCYIPLESVFKVFVFL